MKKGLPIEGVSIEEARAIKAAVKVPVLNTGGYQTASFVRAGISSGAFDGVAIARSLDRQQRSGAAMGGGPRLARRRPAPIATSACSTRPKNPIGCYELARFASRDAMIDELMTIYATRPTLNMPPVQDAPEFFDRAAIGSPRPTRERNGPAIDHHERRAARHLRRDGVAPAAAVSARSGAGRARAVAAGRSDRRRTWIDRRQAPHAQQYGSLSRHRRPFRAWLDRRRPKQRHAVLGLAGVAAAVPRGVRWSSRLSRLRVSLSHRRPGTAGGPADRHFQARLPGCRSRLVQLRGLPHRHRTARPRMAGASPSPACRRTISTSIASSASCSRPAPTSASAPTP